MLQVMLGDTEESKMSNELDNIEMSIEQAKKTINMKNDLCKLIDNPLYKAIIEEGYFKEEASRLVLYKATPNAANAEEQEAIENQIIAIGQLRQYFVKVMQLGNMAEKGIRDDQEAREEILAEEL